MNTKFVIRGGSVPGTDHTDPGSPGWKNNQDAYFIRSNSEYTFGVVADGCGEGKHSEVGANYGVKLLDSLIAKLYPRYRNLLNTDDGNTQSSIFFNRLRDDFLAHIRIFALSLDDSLSNVVKEYLSFTIIGVLVTPKWSYVFHAGDGSFMINGKLTQIGPFPKNEPPYLTLSLTNSNQVFKVESFKTDDLDSCLITTDGFDYLISSVGQKSPQGNWTIGPVTEWVEDERLWKREDAIRGRLALYNKEHAHEDDGVPFIKRGHLKDDITIVVLKRNSNSILS